MPVTIETTGLTANSYASVARAKEVWDGRLQSYAGKSDDQIAVALLEGSEYMDARFNFIGLRRSVGQTREWPRYHAYDNRGDPVIDIHPIIELACIQYAFRRLNGIVLMPDPVPHESGRVVKSIDEKVGPIGSSVQFSESAAFELPIFPSTDRLLYQHGLVVRPSGGITIGSVARG